MAQDVVIKEQRVRDPVHGLIVFSARSEFEQLMWRLLNAAEFQRLRRIKQLGFSELVYPGATHTRFAHSVGVFHTARSLVELLKTMLGDTFSRDRSDAAICAALLHDLGHGPFSHTFEGVLKSRKIGKKHEKWTVEIIRGDTEIGGILAEYDVRTGSVLREGVANLLEEEYPSDIYSSVVSSQFDADRLDYLRRDRMMTGTEHGGFDSSWLLNNLEIETLTIGGDDETGAIEAPGFVVGSKGLNAAEAYLLGRFHLYMQVYMHKTTRSAEKMLGALLDRIAVLAAEEDFARTGLPAAHPIIAFFGGGGATLHAYLNLDDTVIWGALPFLEQAPDETVADLAMRLRRRRLYKCFDVGARAGMKRGDAAARFQKRLNEAVREERLSSIDAFVDRAKVTAYKVVDYESRDALHKIGMRQLGRQGSYDDIANVSNVVKAIGTHDLFRVYARNSDSAKILTDIWEEASR